tara:strand:- start:7819 stop:8244 length:426 start_codon:yes stop_codon:yes gene_type:complete
MKISKKAEYGLRALAILAGSSPQGPLQIQELAERGKIPVKFLEQILLILKRGGLLRSKRGIGGGYQLNRSASEISLCEVIELVDGNLFERREHSDNSGIGFQGLTECLEELNLMIKTYLSEQTIASLLLREEPEGILAIDI